MSDLMLDTATGDVALTNGELRLNADLESIRQHLMIRLRFFLGEWFLDPDLGVPYFTEVFVGKPNADAITAVFKKEILETPGVQTITSFQLNFSAVNRVLTITFKANTDFGLLDFSNILRVGG